MFENKVIQEFKEQVEKESIKRNYGYNIFDDIAIITTGLSVWKIGVEIDSNKKRVCFHLYHQNSSCNPKIKHRWHYQGFNFDLRYVFSDMIKGKKYYLGRIS